MLARIVWVVLVVFTLSTFIAERPFRVFCQLQTVCSGATCVFTYGQLTHSAAHRNCTDPATVNWWICSIGSGTRHCLGVGLLCGCHRALLSHNRLIGWRCWSRCSWSSLGQTFSPWDWRRRTGEHSWEVLFSIVTVLGYVSLVLLSVSLS